MNRPHHQMVSNLKKPGSEILASLTPEKASAAHMLTGVFDEHLELAVELQAISLVRPHEEGFEQLHNNVLLEAGDLFFYLQGLHQDMLDSNLDLGQITSATEEFKSEGRLMGDSLDLMRSLVIVVATPVKRYLYYEKDFSAGELSDSISSLAGLMLATIGRYDLTLNDVIEGNKHKLLGHRYKEGSYSNEQANSRKDEKELDTSKTKT